MMHFTCDLCGKLIDQESRAIVKIEVFLAEDSTNLQPGDLEEDPLEAVSQLLKHGDFESQLPPAQKRMRYDLCAECHKKFLNDPLGKDRTHKLSFSEN